jgi:hypothetical protein
MDLSMRHRMTADDLAAAWDEQPSEVTRLLLWEIARLRSTIKRAHQVRRAVGDTPPPNVSPTVWGALCSELDTEPCIVDKPTARQKQRIEQGIAKSNKKG